MSHSNQKWHNFWGAGQPSSKNITTVKYNSSGTEMGVARYDTNSQQYTSVDIAVDISGNIYVAGSGEDANPWSDYLTIKYRIDNFNIIKRGPGNGTITSNIPGIDCGSDCSEDFTVNSVTLTVTTDPGSFFAGWSGDNDCSDGVVSIDMDVVTTCIATFNRIEITDLGTLGGDNSRARAINESGQIVGRSELPSGYIHATLWENGILTDLGTIGGLNSEAFDINRWGTVVGGGAIGTPLADKSSNFLWDVDSGIVQLNAPLVYPAAISSASDLYPKITGELTDFTGAAIWDVGFEAIHRNLGTLGGNRAVPNAINNFDEVTGYSTTAAGEIRAFSYSYVDPTVGYVMQNLGLLSNFGFDTFGTDINNRSQIVGYEIASQVPSSRAFLWTAEDGMIDLGGLGGLGGGSVAYGISDKGHVVGRSWAPPGEWHAFFWTPYGGMVDLGGLSSGDSRASDINDNVEIVGRSTTPSGFEHATLWKLLNTATGDGITFDLGTQVSVTFGQVQTEGYTSLVERTGNPGGSASDGNFFFLGKYYNIKTTAIFNNSAGIEICINYLDADIPQGTNESDLKLTHLQGGYWVDITTSLDIDQNVICGIVNDLSWFAVAVQDTMTPDLLSMFEIKKAEVEWDKQKIKVHGEVGLPAGKDPFDVSPDGTVTISLSTLGQVVNQSVIFDVKGDEGKKWEYKDDSLSGVTKYKINWKGVKFDYNQEIRIKSNHIGEGSTALEVYPKGIKPLTIAVGGVTIDIDELGAVSVTPETLEIDIDDDGEIEVELPFTLTPDMTIVISGAVSDTVIVGDYYTAAVGKFKIEASFNPSGYDGDLTPATLSLEVTLGDVGYPGSFQIIESDWKKLKTIEWKYKR